MNLEGDGKIEKIKGVAKGDGEERALRSLRLK
jgi:hypothetical protein